jgi:hypothetical protein
MGEMHDMYGDDENGYVDDPIEIDPDYEYDNDDAAILQDEYSGRRQTRGEYRLTHGREP